MLKTLSTYQKEIVNLIIQGKIHAHRNSIVSYPKKRVRYSKALQALIKSGLVLMFHGELIVDSDLYNKYVKQWNFQIKNNIKK
jgi:hypothetical protein